MKCVNPERFFRLFLALCVLLALVISAHLVRMHWHRQWAIRNSALRVNIAQIKVHKTASTTMQAILIRFAFAHNLTLALPLPGKNYFGWPWAAQLRYVTLSKNTTRPNVFSGHVIHNRTFFTQLMPPDTALLAGLRRPFQYLQSVFHFFNISSSAGVGKGSGAFERFLKNISHYDNVFRSKHYRPFVRDKHCNIGNRSMTKNSIATDLGYIEGSNVQEFIKRVFQEIDLVFVVERFDESLVLLRRLMNWSVKDILYNKINSNRYKEIRETDRPDLVELHRRWSPVDFQLYEAAEVRLFHRMRALGEDFLAELKEFRRVLAVVGKFCQLRKDFLANSTTETKVGNSSKLVWPASRWSKGFSIGKFECDALQNPHSTTIQTMSKALHKGERFNKSELVFC